MYKKNDINIELNISLLSDTCKQKGNKCLIFLFTQCFVCFIWGKKVVSIIKIIIFILN